MRQGIGVVLPGFRRLPDRLKVIPEKTDSQPHKTGGKPELQYLDRLVQDLGEYTLAARESEVAAYGMEHWFRGRFKRGERRLFLEAEAADDAFLSYSPDALSAYMVAPTAPEKGDWCYKMLFEADTHRLVYLSKHRIDARHGAGFLPDEIKRLSK